MPEGGDDGTAGRLAEKGQSMKKRKWYSLYGQVIERRNLLDAFRKVKANRGAPGVDGETIARFEAQLDCNLDELERLLRQKRYKPSPVLRHYIEKPDGSLRPLGIPTVRDRVVQQALLNVLDRHGVFESKFLDVSYGFRPGRSTRMAMRRVKAHLEEGYTWVVDVDLKSYFDTIPHERLMEFVAEEISDGSVLGLIRAWLTAGVMDEGKITYPERGTPQGGVISPLLANIYLHYFDVKMTQHGYRIVRYADDFVILCESENRAKTAKGLLMQILEGELDLTVHPTKTRIVHVGQGFEFLGWHVQRAYGRLYFKPRKKALQKFKDKVRELTPRHGGQSLKAVIDRLNPVLLGWGRYFGVGHVKGLYETLDQWIRMRVRSVVFRKKAQPEWNWRLPTAELTRLGLVSLLTDCYVPR